MLFSNKMNVSQVFTYSFVFSTCYVSATLGVEIPVNKADKLLPLWSLYSNRGDNDKREGSKLYGVLDGSA